MEYVSLIQSMMPDLRRALPLDLYDHCVRTMETAVDIARSAGADESACAVAGLLHDYCRHFPGTRLLKLAAELGIVFGDVERHRPLLLHGPVASELVSRDLGVTDHRILDAIRYHTTGRAGMCAVEQVVYVADKVEPGKFPTLRLSLEGPGRGADGEEPLKRFLVEHANDTILRLVKAGAAIHPLVVEMRNWIIQARVEI